MWEIAIRLARVILLALILTHDKSLYDESLQTLLPEDEDVLTFKTLTVETISYVDSKIVNSPMTISPTNLLTIKFNDLIQPPVKFQKGRPILQRVVETSPPYCICFLVKVAERISNRSLVKTEVEWIPKFSGWRYWLLRDDHPWNN